MAGPPLDPGADEQPVTSVDDEGASVGLPGLPPEFFAGSPAMRRHEVERLAFRRVDGARGMKAIRRTFEGGDRDVIAALTSVVEHDDDATVVRAALFGLCRMSDPAAVPGLLLGLDCADRASRVHAVTGLGRLRAREAVPRLVPLLKDSYLRAEVAEALVEIRDARAVEPLRGAADSSPRWRRAKMRRYADALEQAVGTEAGNAAD